MIKFLQDNITLVITTFGLGSLLTMASTVVKSFNQKKLNRSFENFAAGTAKTIRESKTVQEVGNSLNKNLNDFLKDIADIKAVVAGLVNDIREIRNSLVLEDLVAALKDLEVVKETLDFKDKVIEAYAKDMKQISITLNKERGGYDDILETEQ